MKIDDGVWVVRYRLNRNKDVVEVDGTRVYTLGNDEILDITDHCLSPQHVEWLLKLDLDGIAAQCDQKRTRRKLSEVEFWFIVVGIGAAALYWAERLIDWWLP